VGIEINVKEHSKWGTMNRKASVRFRKERAKQLGRCAIRIGEK
jgi:hypothetical protein